MKRLLLLSSLIFGLALSACGGNNPGAEHDPTKAKLKDTCTKEKACNAGFVCVAKANNANEGTCETTCNNGACSGANQVCKTGVAGLDGKPVDVCRAGSGSTGPNEGAPAKFGEVCNANKKCDTNLVCVADAGQSTTGHCYNACDQNGKCSKVDVCKKVDSVNNEKVDACLTPPPIQEGQECKADDTCQDGTICLAKHASDTVGICTKTKECTQIGDCETGECSEETLPGGKTLKVCLPKWCTDNSSCKANEYCAASPQFDLTRGHCKEAECEVMRPEVCGPGKGCLHDVFFLGAAPMSPGICGPEGGARFLVDECNEAQPCGDPRLTCVKNSCRVPCDVPGFQTQCHFNDFGSHHEWCIPGLDSTNPNKMFCGQASETPEDWRNKGLDEECNRTQMCDLSQNLRCHIPKGSDTGKCVKIDSMCTKDTDCNQNDGESCMEKYEAGTLIGSTNIDDTYFEKPFKTCQK